MKSLLLLSLISFLFQEEISYNFGGTYSMQGNVTLTVDVRDGSYWVTFVSKSANGTSPCELSERASVKHGRLYVQVHQGKQQFRLQIDQGRKDEITRMVVRGPKKSDQAALAHFCQDASSLTGEYTRTE